MIPSVARLADLVRCDRLRALFGSLVTCLLATLCSTAAGVVVISDGFGDADINNVNGIEDVDVSVQGGLGSTTYIPGRVFIDGMSGEPTNMELDAPLDAADTGIRWIQMRGFTGAVDTEHPGAGSSKPSIRIVDDSQGAMLETKPTSEPGGLGIAAINSGYAMSWESRGGGSTAAGFFDRTIALGPQVDDEVKVSFDFRVWRDSPNLNGSNPNNVPTGLGSLRFGIFQDTDNQLGQTNPFAGRQVDENGDPLSDPTNSLTPGDLTDSFRPAVWGQDEGLFEGNLVNAGAGFDIGTVGDNGWTAQVPLGDSAPPVLRNGSSARIREEVQTDRILQGQDVQTIAQPQDTTPEDPFNPTFDFVNMATHKVYHIELSLKRATDTDPGDTITATLTVTDVATQQVYTLSGTEDFSDPLTGGIQSDSWDYFALRNDGSGAAEFDFLLDNFKVELFGSNVPTALPGDFNGDMVVDAADYTLWRDNLGAASDSVINGAGDGVDGVTAADYAVWRGNYGASASIAFDAASAPEPSCLVLLSALAAWSVNAVRRRP